jgi:hypothetical protein
MDWWMLFLSGDVGNLESMLPDDEAKAAAGIDR